jgi:hypothetical protein
VDNSPKTSKSKKELRAIFIKSRPFFMAAPLNNAQIVFIHGRHEPGANKAPEAVATVDKCGSRKHDLLTAFKAA